MKVSDLRIGDVYYAMRNVSLGNSRAVNIEGSNFDINWLEKPGYNTYGYEYSGDYVFSLSDGISIRTFKQEMEYDSYDEEPARGDLYEVEEKPVERVEYRRKK